jgi:hypothetical protein
MRKIDRNLCLGATRGCAYDDHTAAQEDCFFDVVSP